MMIVYKCQNCGYTSQKWLGRCPDCGSWNSFLEETIIKTKEKRKTLISPSESKPYLLKEATSSEEKRIITGVSEIDRIFGGGIMLDSLTLLGGPPGIGKSTLALQIADKISKKYNVLYVSGEESSSQIKYRSKRLNLDGENIYLLSESNLENIIENIKKLSPSFLIIDSIQTLYKPEIPSSPGTVTQIKETAQELLMIAKSMGLTVLILGHVTKGGEIAGPKILEHIVDTVLYFETEKNYPYRVLRVYKNRFGPTSEIGVFEMKQEGLVEVKNPSMYFLSERPKNTSGSVVISTIEGTKSLLLEVQALVTKTTYSLPRRIFTGLDFNRGIILISILEKRLNIPLQNQDIFINVVGGMKLREPSADLGICVAIFSAFFDFSLSPDILFIGEIGLGGETRGVSQILERVLEAERLGFKNVILPKANMKELTVFKGDLRLNGVKTLSEGIDVAKKC